MSQDERPTIACEELKVPADGPLDREWQTFCRELPRLLAEGHEGKFALIKHDELIGVFEKWEEATAQGHARFSLGGFMAQPISPTLQAIRAPWFNPKCPT